MSGEIVDMQGNVLGHHDAYYGFTIGQRRGLDIGGLPERSYVVDIDPLARRVVIGPAQALDRSHLMAERVHWISGHRPDAAIEVTARVRSRQVDVAARVEHIDDSRARVTFSDPMRAIAPGQAVVFYDDEVCLGGGWIGR